MRHPRCSEAPAITLENGAGLIDLRTLAAGSAAAASATLEATLRDRPDTAPRGAHASRYAPLPRAWSTCRTCRSRSAAALLSRASRRPAPAARALDRLPAARLRRRPERGRERLPTARLQWPTRDAAGLILADTVLTRPSPARARTVMSAMPSANVGCTSALHDW